MPNTQETLQQVNNSSAAEVDVRKYDVTVKRVQVIVNPETGYTSVQLAVDKPIEGFKQQDDGTYAPAQVDSLNFTRGSLTRQLANLDEDFACLRDCSETAFDRKVFAITLRGAKLTVKRTLHKKGDTIERATGDSYVLDRDQWFSEIVKASLSERAKAKIDDALTL